MSDILQDLSRDKLIRAMEENLASFLPVFGKFGESYIDNPAGVKRSITDIPMSLFNSVMDARLAPEQVDATIQTIQADARRRNVPVLWWIGPSTQPANLDKSLEKHGFSLDEESPGMAVDLGSLNESLPKPAGLSIRHAQDDDAWQDWCHAMMAGFEAPASADYAVKGWHELLRQADPETVLAYTGWLDNNPVATSLLFLAAGVAGIYSVATIPDARRKGIGALITQYPLLQARAKGYKIGVLESSEMGLGVYSSLGFQEFCRINSYRWDPRSAQVNP